MQSNNCCPFEENKIDNLICSRWIKQLLHYHFAMNQSRKCGLGMGLAFALLMAILFTIGANEHAPPKHTCDDSNCQNPCSKYPLLCQAAQCNYTSNEDQVCVNIKTMTCTGNCVEFPKANFIIGVVFAVASWIVVVGIIIYWCREFWNEKVSNAFRQLRPEQDTNYVRLEQGEESSLRRSEELVKD